MAAFSRNKRKSQLLEPNYGPLPGPRNLDTTPPSHQFNQSYSSNQRTYEGPLPYSNPSPWRSPIGMARPFPQQLGTPPAVWNSSNQRTYEGLFPYSNPGPWRSSIRMARPFRNNLELLLLSGTDQVTQVVVVSHPTHLSVVVSLALVLDKEIVLILEEAMAFNTAKVPTLVLDGEIVLILEEATVFNTATVPTLVLDGEMVLILEEATVFNTATVPTLSCFTTNPC
ncbi:hypothetical protein IFM89_023145 [Coptis chinensis]|uniref:Uncharacterized protein n=1 Tax=Coptis chinensis TaxID=261450 RepID=A0A835H4R0_9MAGN|nr:hypothetical protein IFM89_023145 [Coptis chinensis]